MSIFPKKKKKNNKLGDNKQVGHRSINQIWVKTAGMVGWPTNKHFVHFLTILLTKKKSDLFEQSDVRGRFSVFVNGQKVVILKKIGPFYPRKILMPERRLFYFNQIKKKWSYKGFSHSPSCILVCIFIYVAEKFVKSCVAIKFFIFFLQKTDG